MKVLVKENMDTVKSYPMIKTKMPKFSNHRGRTWDSRILVIEGIEVTIYLDTTWGMYSYFTWKGESYKVINDLWDYTFMPNSPIITIKE